MNFEAKH